VTEKKEYFLEQGLQGLCSGWSGELFNRGGNEKTLTRYSHFSLSSGQITSM